jgi:uncharacterized protein with ParB-like and HNH nuclease domain
MSPRLNASDKKLGNVVCNQDSYFMIPRYQRNYSWTIEQAKDFWQDLRKEGETFFVGSIVLNTETKVAVDGYAEVIDGQQRLTTSMLLACALREHFKPLDNEVAQDVQREFIGKKDRITKQYKYKLLVSDSLRVFFENHILKYKREEFPEVVKKGQMKLVSDNFQFFYDEISKELDSYSEASEKLHFLNKLYTALLDMVVIEIKVSDSDEAYDIFETMNARGAELTVADLVKNHLFKQVRKTPTGDDIAKKKWSVIIDNLDGSGLDFTTFLRYHWLSRHEFLTKKRIFKAIKLNVTDYRKFLDDLEKDSEIIKAFGSCHVEDLDLFTASHARNINKSLVTINAIGARGCYVFLLGILRNMSSLNLSKCYKDFLFVEKFIYYYHGVCGLSANKFERFWSTESQKLNTINDVMPKHQTKEINRWRLGYQSDLRSQKSRDLFSEEFSKKMVYKNSSKSRSMIRYFFDLYNQQWQPEGFDHSKVNIEHILPQDPSKWGLMKKDIKKYVNVIGNLTMIGSDYNQEMSNEPLEQKIPTLAKSDIKLNKSVIELCQNTDPVSWDQDKIEQRTNLLLEAALDLCDY